MSSNYKPEGYNVLSPYCIVDDPDTFVRFLETVFQAKSIRKMKHSDGSLAHQELFIEDSILMLSRATPEFPAKQYMLHVYVPDV